MLTVCSESYETLVNYVERLIVLKGRLESAKGEFWSKHIKNIWEQHTEGYDEGISTCDVSTLH